MFAPWIILWLLDDCENIRDQNVNISWILSYDLLELDCCHQNQYGFYISNDFNVQNYFLVTRLEDVDLPSIGARDVLVKMLAAPINPSDINMIQGVTSATDYQQ